MAKRLAERLGCAFYDRELLALAAKESGFSEKFFEQNDEHKGFFRSLFHLHAPHVSDNSFYASDFSQEGLFKFQSDAIRRAASEGPCIFVGRCADYVLRDMEGVVSVFITAHLEERVRQIMRRKGLDEQAARKVIENGESDRASYYNYYTGKRWGDSSSYDLCINSSILGLEGTEEYIEEFVKKAL